MSDAAIAQLVDRTEITDVLYRYAKGIDDKDMQQVLDCFASDVEMDLLGRKISGKEMLTRLFRGEFGGPKASIGLIASMPAHMSWPMS